MKRYRDRVWLLVLWGTDAIVAYLTVFRLWFSDTVDERDKEKIRDPDDPWVAAEKTKKENEYKTKKEDVNENK